ncbi:MAG: hypothetical protein HQL64_17170 [Magnetococcales bacterium]|nr:hypothetical protein [Magnetococcales bacterium]
MKGSTIEDAKRGTESFKEKWRELSDNAEFQEIEQEFAVKKIYHPFVKKVKHQMNVDFSTRSRALQEVAFSTAVQHGEGGGNDVVMKALHGRDGSLMSDRKIIEEIYKQRIKKYGADKRRYEQEQELALDLLARESEASISSRKR